MSSYVSFVVIELSGSTGAILDEQLGTARTTQSLQHLYERTIRHWATSTYVDAESGDGEDLGRGQYPKRQCGVPDNRNSSARSNAA